MIRTYKGIVEHTYATACYIVPQIAASLVYAILKDRHPVEMFLLFYEHFTLLSFHQFCDRLAHDTDSRIA